MHGIDSGLPTPTEVDALSASGSIVLSWVEHDPTTSTYRLVMGTQDSLGGPIDHAAEIERPYETTLRAGRPALATTGSVIAVAWDEDRNGRLNSGEVDVFYSLVGSCN